MPKPPNRSNPVATIRARLGMKIEEFAGVIGYGVAVLKQVEAGRRRITPDLAEKIEARTGARVPIASGTGNKDREDLRPLRREAHQFVGLSPRLNVIPLVGLIDLLALYFSMLQSNVNPRLGEIAIQHEIDQILKRWNISRATYDSIRKEFRDFLWASHGGRSRLESWGDILAESAPYRRAKKDRDEVERARLAELEKEITRDRVGFLKKVGGNR